MLLVNLGHHGSKANKGATLEVAQVLTITCAALRKNNDGIKIVCFLSKLDPLGNLLLNSLLALLRFPVNDKALGCLQNVTNK